MEVAYEAGIRRAARVCCSVEVDLLVYASDRRSPRMTSNRQPVVTTPDVWTITTVSFTFYNRHCPLPRYVAPSEHHQGRSVNP